MRDAQCHTMAGTVLEQEAGPEAGPVERPGEQPRHRGRQHFHGRRRALAGPAPARTADHALVGLDLDLDEGGFVDTVGDIRLPATGAHTRLLRRFELFGALLEPGPLGTTMAGGARAAGRAGARSAASPASRSCGRTAPSTALPRSREASQAALPASRSGFGMPSHACAAGRSPWTTI